MQTGRWATSPVSPTAPSTCVPPSKAFEQAFYSRFLSFGALQTLTCRPHTCWRPRRRPAPSPRGSAAPSSDGRPVQRRGRACRGSRRRPVTRAPRPRHCRPPPTPPRPPCAAARLQKSSCCSITRQGSWVTPAAAGPWMPASGPRSRLFLFPASRGRVITACGRGSGRGLGAAPPPRVSLPPSAADAGAQGPLGRLSRPCVRGRLALQPAAHPTGWLPAGLPLRGASQAARSCRINRNLLSAALCHRTWRSAWAGQTWTTLTSTTSTGPSSEPGLACAA